MEEASCESPIFGFRPTNFRETRKSFFAARSRRDANLGKSQRESATRFSGNPKVFFEGSLKRNANFRVPPPLALYNIKRHQIREKGPRGGESGPRGRASLRARSQHCTGPGVPNGGGECLGSPATFASAAFWTLLILVELSARRSAIFVRRPHFFAGPRSWPLFAASHEAQPLSTTSLGASSAKQA